MIAAFPITKTDDPHLAAYRIATYLPVPAWRSALEKVADPAPVRDVLKRMHKIILDDAESVKRGDFSISADAVIGLHNIGRKQKL